MNLFIFVPRAFSCKPARGLLQDQFQVCYPKVSSSTMWLSVTESNPSSILFINLEREELRYELYTAIKNRGFDGKVFLL